MVNDICTRCHYQILTPPVKNDEGTYHKDCLEVIPEEDVWSLDVTLSRWILPRLRRIMELEAEVGGHPCDLTPEGWRSQLLMMIRAFELIANEQDDTPEDRLSINEGLDSFRYWFRALWT